MRTVSFADVYNQTMRMCGLDPTDDSFSATRQELVADFINRRVEEAWEYAFWPDLMVTEERTPDSDDVVDYEQSGQTALAEVEGVYDADPEVSAHTVATYAWAPNAAGIQITDVSVGATVYVRYRRRPNQFTRVAWSEDGTYTVGELVYYATTGECYQAQLSGTDEVWVYMAFPRVLMDFTVLAAAADFLREMNQQERADGLEARAYQALERKYMIVFKQQKQATRTLVRVE